MQYRALVPALLAVASIASFAPTAHAAVVTVPYDVSHTFDFSPAGDVLQTFWSWSAFARARLPLRQDSKRANMAVMPGDQTKTATASAASANSEANARLSFTKPAGNRLLGTVRSDGFAQADRAVAGADAVAFSISSFRARGGTTLKNGFIQWGRTFASSITGISGVGDVGAAQVRDPIDFQIFDINGDLLFEDRLFWLDVDLWGPHSITVTSGVLSASVTDMDFSMAVNVAYVAAGQGGTAELRVRKGIVTESAASGVFAGLLPAVGEDGDFSFPLGDIAFDYDLGVLPPGAETIDFGFGNGGSAHVAPTPGAATLLLGGLGLLGMAGRRRRAVGPA